MVIFLKDCLYKQKVLGGSSAISYSFVFKLDWMQLLSLYLARTLS